MQPEDLNPLDQQRLEARKKMGIEYHQKKGTKKTIAAITLLINAIVEEAEELNYPAYIYLIQTLNVSTTQLLLYRAWKERKEGQS